MGGSIKLGPFSHRILSIHPFHSRTQLPRDPHAGWDVVVHTGDWKIDPDPLLGEVTDESRSRRLGEEGVLALVCDFTNALVNGEFGIGSRSRGAP